MSATEHSRAIMPGDRVIETALTCQQGDLGTAYRGEHRDRPSYGLLLVRWDDGMHTSLTGGSRRIEDVPAEEFQRLRDRALMRDRGDRYVAAIEAVTADIAAAPSSQIAALLLTTHRLCRELCSLGGLPTSLTSHGRMIQDQIEALRKTREVS